MDDAMDGAITDRVLLQHQSICCSLFTIQLKGYTTINGPNTCTTNDVISFVFFSSDLRKRRECCSGINNIFIATAAVADGIN